MDSLKTAENLEKVIEMITSLARLDFSKRITNLDEDGGLFDAVSIGLNMLSDELESSVVSVQQLNNKNENLESVILKMNEFKYALDSSSIVSITDPKGNITYVNDRFCKISKYSREELIGHNQRIVNSGYHPTEFWKEMWNTIRLGEIWNDEVRDRAKDGSIYWVNTTIIPFVNERGAPYKYISIRRDITNSKVLQNSVMRAIISSNEQDRELFAEDLHEGLAQSLAALMMQVGVIELKLKDVGDSQLQDSINFIKTYIQDSIENTRLIATNLMPRTMMEYGIEPSLRSYISNIQNDSRRYIQFKCKIENPIDKDIEISLYRVIVALIDKVRENNVDSILISINNGTNRALTVKVEVRCNQEQVKTCSIESFGFESNKKRIEALGGSFRLQSLQNVLKLIVKF